MNDGSFIQIDNPKAKQTDLAEDEVILKTQEDDDQTDNAAAGTEAEDEQDEDNSQTDNTDDETEPVESDSGSNSEAFNQIMIYRFGDDDFSSLNIPSFGNWKIASENFEAAE